MAGQSAARRLLPFENEPDRVFCQDVRQLGMVSQSARVDRPQFLDAAIEHGEDVGAGQPRPTVSTKAVMKSGAA